MSKTGAIGRFFGSLLSFITRTLISIMQYLALIVSIGVTVYTVGDFTRRIVHDKKQCWRSSTGVTQNAVEALLRYFLVALYLFAKCSLLSLVAYASLTALAGTIGFRVFKLVEGQIKKTDGSNPFKPYLEQEISVPQERVHSQVDVLVEHAQALVKHLRHLFLVENLVDSVKFGMLLYTLTYVGSWFSGISLVLIFIIALFTVPKFYEVYKEPVDHYVGIAKENIDKVQHQISDKLPFLKKVPEGEKKEQ